MFTYLNVFSVSWLAVKSGGFQRDLLSDTPAGSTPSVRTSSWPRYQHTVSCSVCVWCERSCARQPSGPTVTGCVPAIGSFHGNAAAECTQHAASIPTPPSVWDPPEETGHAASCALSADHSGNYGLWKRSICSWQATDPAGGLYFF